MGRHSFKVSKLMKKMVAIAGGVALGQIYYFFMLKKIPFPGNTGRTLSILICAILGIGSAISIQMRCICVLILPMYCGKPGRGVLKAVLLTYIVAGPISNMCYNAGEVVRVFACTTQLAQDLSRQKHALMMGPLKSAALGVNDEVEEVKKLFRQVRPTFWPWKCHGPAVLSLVTIMVSAEYQRLSTIEGSYGEILEALEMELVDVDEVEICKHENDFVDDLLHRTRRSLAIDEKYSTGPKPTISDIVNFYKKKLSYICENQVSRAVSLCIVEFSKAYVRCSEFVPHSVQFALCWPLKLTEMCDLGSNLKGGGMCDSGSQVSPCLEKVFIALQRIRKEFVENTNDIFLQYKTEQEDQPLNVEDAIETSEHVLHAFSEKAAILHAVNTIVNICTAFFALRIFTAATMYHDLYLQDIDFDNVYLTSYFRMLDGRRNRDSQCVLLPLKKMERSKYVDIQSFSYEEATKRKLVSQILKVLLEVVTTTTFVMLDRLFYEALDVVRQHAEKSVESTPTRDLEIKVEGTGLLATAYRSLLHNLASRNHTLSASNARCLPRPLLMPYKHFINIYGCYLWILLLLFVSPYTARMRRSICSYFYPRREKQRILHLYNDILKKRMKMNKTLRRKAVQSVRTYYLTGESLLSMRMKFPQILGWLRILPAARMTCLICDEVEPSTETKKKQNLWHTCCASKCPFIHCAECWLEAGRKCLACDPTLTEMSDIDSLTEDELPAY